MITDADIKKLSKVFATKDDLKAMESRQDAKFATRDDLKKFATRDDLKKFATKDDLKALATKEDLKPLAKDADLKSVKKTLDEFTDYAMPALGALFKWTDEIHQTVSGRRTSRKTSSDN
jgi:hypothetical protein